MERYDIYIPFGIFKFPIITSWSPGNPWSWNWNQCSIVLPNTKYNLSSPYPSSDYKHFKFIFNCVYECVYMHTWIQGLKMHEEHARSPRGELQPPNMVARNQNHVFCKSYKCPYYLNHLSLASFTYFILQLKSFMVNHMYHISFPTLIWVRITCGAFENNITWSLPTFSTWPGLGDQRICILTIVWWCNDSWCWTGTL